jgi:hypothetical protein
MKNTGTVKVYVNSTGINSSCVCGKSANIYMEINQLNKASTLVTLTFPDFLGHTAISDV